MARLRRAYYDDIGVPDARFMDLTLPFTGADDLPDDSVILLKNGGGKSALLSLIFAVIRPSLREFLGQKDDKVRNLSDYVLRDDHGVVVLEWELDTGPRGGEVPVRLLTGAFLERKAASAARADVGTENEGPLTRFYFSYYSFADTPATSLEALPLYTDGSRRFRYPAAGFEAQLDELAEAAPHAQVFYTQHHGEWLKLLVDRGIDADIFAYQIRMNQREGGAKDLFAACTTVEAYMDLFLEVLIDRRFGENIRDNLTAHREALLRRKTQLVPGRALAESLIGALEPLRATAEARTALVDRGRGVATRLRALVTYANRRLAYLATSIGDLTAMRDDAQRDADLRREDAAAHRRQAATLQRDVALVTAREAREENRRIEEGHTELVRLTAGWQAALPLREARHHEEAARRHREELADRERKHVPLLERLKAAARMYLEALAAHDEVLGARIDELDATIAEHEAVATREQQKELAEAKFESERLADAKAASSQDAQLRRDLGQLVAQHVFLREHEAPVAASLRLAEAQRAAAKAFDETEGAVARTAKVLRLHQEALAHAREAHGSAAQEVALASQALEMAETAAQRVESLPHLAAVLELERVDATRLHEDAVGLLRQSARRAYEQALLARAVHATAARNVDALRDTGLLPCSADAAAVLATLRPAFPQAHAGWHYLADAMTAAEASALIDRAPDVAMGVVVRDADFDAAVHALRLTPPVVDAPVRIVRQSDVLGAAEGSGYVVRPATDAHFDRQAGRVALVRLERQVDETEAAVARAEAEHQGLQTTATTLENFLHTYGAAWFERQRMELERLGASLRTAAEALESARSALAGTEAEAARTAANRESARTTLETVERRQRELAGFRQRFGDDVDRYRSEAEAARADAFAAHERARDAAARAAEARIRAEEARQTRGGISNERAVLAAEMQGVLYVERPVHPQRGDRRALMDAYTLAKDTYEQKIDSRGLSALADQAEKEAQQKRRDLRSRLSKQRQGWTEETVGALLDRLADSADAQNELDRVDAERNRLFAEFGNHGKVLNAAERALEEARARCASVGIPMTPAEELARLEKLPNDPDHALRTRWGEELAQAVRAADVADADAQAAEEMRDTAAHDLSEARRAEAVVNGGLGLLRAAEGQQSEFLGLFEVDASAAAAQEPTGDDAFSAAIHPWTIDRSALLGDWHRLDEHRDAAARHMGQLLTGIDPRIIDPFLTRIRDAEPSLLEKHVVDLVQSVSERRDQMTLAIAEIDTHRNELIDLTLLAGEEGRRLLRQLHSRAMVPARVVKFGGSPFLKIDGLKAADPAAERAAAETLVESLTALDAPIPNALTLIQQAVRALTPDISMSVLYPKPEKTRVEFWPITRLGKMSGGEGLTIATLLYCTLARVRAITQGRTGTASGVLLFDNPFGTASSATFVTLQREVAREFGVQLIYFTGVLDMEAIRLLPNRVRLGTDHRDRARGFMLVERHEEDPLVEALRAMDTAGERPIDSVQVVADDATYVYDGLTARLTT